MGGGKMQYIIKMAIKYSMLKIDVHIYTILEKREKNVCF